MRTTMQATVTDSGTLRKQLTVTYSQAEVDSRREQVLKKLGGQVKLDGFRPGKSSKAMVAKRFGSAAVQQAREELADEGFKQALHQHQLKPIGPIANDSLKSEEGLTVVVSFDVKPVIALPDPKSLTVTAGEIVISDHDVQQALDGLCKRAGSMDALLAEETIAEDDSITLTGAVTVAGKEVRKLHDFHHLVGGYSLLGKLPADVIALFKDKGVGAQVTFTATLPASFTPAEAAGKEAEISVTVQAAQRQRPAKADADLAKRLGIDSIDALKERLREQLKSQKEQEQHQQQITELTDALIAKVEIALPPKLLEASLKDNLEPRVKQAEQEGKPAAEIAKITEEVKANVEKSLKRFLLLDAVAEAHQVQVTREDIDGQIHMAAQRAGRKPQDIADQLAKSGQVNQVVQEIREAKTLEVLLDKVLGREVSMVATAAHGQAGHVHGPDCNH